MQEATGVFLSFFILKEGRLGILISADFRCVDVLLRAIRE